MSLHGTIEVNNKRIGVWSAQRIATGDPNVYRCEVWSLSPQSDGFAYSNKAEFEIEHRHQDGAVALASKVLAHATTPTTTEASTR